MIFSRRCLIGLLLCTCCMLGLAQSLRAAVIWVEGEKPTKASVKRHPWWYDKVDKSELSGGDYISNWGDKPGELEYDVAAPKAGEYDLWVRANPSGTALSYQINGGPVSEIDFSKEKRDNTNIAEDHKPDLRFIAWIHVGNVTLHQGKNVVAFRMHSQNNNHGMLDCFVFSDTPFVPHGLSHGDGTPVNVASRDGWFGFSLGADKFLPEAAFDLRSLNEAKAGDGGFIVVKDGQFVHSKTGQPIRFWGIDGPPNDMKDRADLRKFARLMAKYGVNMVRLHAAPFNGDGVIDPNLVQHAIDIVESLKEEGIYSDFSVYWYGFYSPKANAEFLQGYDGKTAPVAALFFNKDFQARYRQWWQALLHTPGKVSGRKLIDEPALAGIEMQNEDSLFFWTFGDRGIPDVEMRQAEKLFGDWVIKKHGSIESALKSWRGKPLPRDNAAEGRVAIRPMWNMFHERNARDVDTVHFMTDLQREFYTHTYKFMREELGFKGSITTTGWTTASPEYFGPIDKYTNTIGDFVDRHGYFGCARKGQNAGWAIMDKQTYVDRSALRFDGEDPSKGKMFANPIMDPHYDGKPSTITETSFERPNRYRSEGPLYYACYGALQDSNAFFHFAADSGHWSAKPGYFMQPWTLFSPSTLAQFPAAALIYRQGLVATGDLLVSLNLKIEDIESLKGTPLPQDASLDQFRLADVPSGTNLKANSIIDPLVHYAGRSNVSFSETGGPAKLVDLSALIDHAAQTVVSSTHELKLDYGKGILTINSPSAQGASGNLKTAGPIETGALSIACDMDLAHIVIVSLDGKPLASSGKMLLQVMSEDEPSGFEAEDLGQGRRRIVHIGKEDWLVKKLAGSVKLKRPDASSLTVTTLDLHGNPHKPAGHADAIQLQPDAIYYLIAK